jgi:urease accessory protein
MRRFLICGLFASVFVSPAFAHDGAIALNSVGSGIAHPFSGADHILTMTFVGSWSALTGGRATWLWPATFLAAMLAGFAAATMGLHVSFVEPAILLSIVVFGLAIAFGFQAPTGLGAAITGLFAFFHGHAHGTEVAGASLDLYALGFAIATAALLTVGFGIGFCARRLVEIVARISTRETAALERAVAVGRQT